MYVLSMLFQAIQALRLSASNGHTFGLKFLKYNQSSQCKTKQDSSVSYASASLTILWLTAPPTMDISRDSIG